MLNRAANPYRARGSTPLSSSDWSFEERPGLRIAALFATILLPVVVIAGRLVHIQTQLSGRYAGEFDQTIERFEPIPSQDGRILAADGETLAEDLRIYGLNVHYRWLEDPVDPAWLKSQALSRLERAARRDPQRVAAEQRQVLELRTQLWKNLSRLTAIEPRQLSGRRREIQSRVERIYKLVDQRQSAHEEAPPADDLPADRNLWQLAWRTVVAALTTPPVRDAVEPLVIREQLDYHPLLAEIPLQTAVEVESHPELYPGTRIAVSTRRIYPQGAVAPHIIGYRTKLDDSAIAERRQRFPGGDPLDYRSGDRIGRAGLELCYERHLRGLRGVRKLVLNRRGEVLRTEEVREPRFGRDLVLSLNLPLQRDAERLLDDCLDHEHIDETNGKVLPIPNGGAIIVLDARTGAVVAAASAPRFDLRLFVEQDAAAWKRTLADPHKPLFHRAAEMALPPGSVFKVLSAIAFVESGKLDPAREFHCQGYLDDPDRYRCLIFRNFGAAHGDLNLAAALARSCNVYFFSAARRIGPGPIADWATRFGFGRPTGIDLPGERSGNLPVIDTAAPRVPRRPTRSADDTLQLAIGQARLTATPLQIVRMLAAVANGGTLVTPHLVDSAGPATFAPADAPDDLLTAGPDQTIPELSRRTLEWVRMGLTQVVADPHGTGYKTVRLPDIAIAGKTGTAEPGGDRPDHAWFAGYVPAEKPKFAFVVVLENAGSGGHAAGPVARQLVQAMQTHGLLEGQRIAAPAAN
jgi:penicillin-binding protein 2